jgi:Concanavalin A-like lectin/glucanases superfamily
VFTAHLGDLTEHGITSEINGISRSFEVLDRRRVGYSVLAGNHDLDARTDDQRGLQWAVFPRNQNGISTNWGHELPEETWWHVAVVNDGTHTKLYVEGSELLRNPSTRPSASPPPATRGWSAPTPTTASWRSPYTAGSANCASSTAPCAARSS